MYTQEELERIAAVCRKHSILVIWDEIYGGIYFKEGEVPSLLQLYPERTILTSGLSKLFSAGGYRLGYAIIPEELSELIPPFHALISETYSCVNAPLQYATADLYESDLLGEFIAHTNSIHKTAGDYLQKHFIDMGLRCHPAEGSFYLFPDFSQFADTLREKGFHNSRQLGSHLLNNYGVALLPGEDFQHPGESFAFRVATVDYDGSTALDILERDGNLDEVIEHCFKNMTAGCSAIRSFLKTLR